MYTTLKRFTVFENFRDDVTDGVDSVRRVA